MAGDLSLEACEQQCELSDNCSGFEFYAEDLHKGRSCHLIPADPPAVKPSQGIRWRDATCYVKPINLTTCVAGQEYEKVAPTPTSDRECADITTCVAGQEFETVAPTPTSDRECAKANLTTTYILAGNNFCVCGAEEINCLDYPAPSGAGDDSLEACE